jgi:hypothetical protein
MEKSQRIAAQMLSGYGLDVRTSLEGSGGHTGPIIRSQLAKDVYALVKQQYVSMVVVGACTLMFAGCHGVLFLSAVLLTSTPNNSRKRKLSLYRHDLG